MIKDGNYYFLDYEAHREEFIQILIDYYGKKHEKTIREHWVVVNKVRLSAPDKLYAIVSI